MLPSWQSISEGLSLKEILHGILNIVAILLAGCDANTTGQVHLVGAAEQRMSFAVLVTWGEPRPLGLQCLREGSAFACLDSHFRKLTVLRLAYPRGVVHVSMNLKPSLRISALLNIAEVK
jgi:hypothetical protein